MSTFLSKLFKPKWQSKNKHVRLEAIGSFDSTSQEHQAILIDLAKSDPETEVQKQAIERVNDTQVLIALHRELKEDRAGELKPTIEERLYQLANSQSLSIFDLIIDHDILTEMVIASASPDTFINGLARLENPQSLLKIAKLGKTSRIRQAAAELLETEAELKDLTTAVKSKDKGVYQIAKTKLDAIRQLVKQQSEQETRLSALLQDMEELSRTDNTQLYASKFESLMIKWRELQSAADTDTRTRFEDARSVCQLRIETKEQEAQQAAEAELLEKAGGDEQAATLLTLEETLNRLRDEAASIRESASLDAIVKTQETRWLEATRQSKVEKSQAKHYQVLMGELRKYLAALRQLGEKHDSIEQGVQDLKGLADKPSELTKVTKALSGLLNKVAWPEGFDKPEIIVAAEKALGYSQEFKKQQLKNAEDIQASIQALIAKLDASLEDKQIKRSSRILREIQSLLSQLGASQSDKNTPAAQPAHQTTE